MDTGEFDRQLSAVDSKISELYPVMEEHRQRFLDAALEFTLEWSDELVRKTITEQSSKIEEMGPSAVAVLKSNIGKYKDDLNARIQKEVGAKDLWPHSSEEPVGGRFHLGAEAVNVQGHYKRIDEAVRVVLGDLGAILIDVGLGDPDQYGHWARCETRYRWNIGITWSNTMRAALSDYATQDETLGQLRDKQRATKKERSRYVAKELWDNA